MKDGINLPTIICKKCTLVYTNPIPTYELYNRFYDEAYNNLYFHEERFIPLLEGVPKEIEKKINLMKNYLEDKNSNILEIGSGSGCFLYYLRKEFPNAIGLEPGTNSSFAKEEFKLNIINDYFESHDFSDQKFHMIIMLHVFEHFYDINKALSKLFKLLT
jgi:2-polyprenyl-3-methyl-5-hydroxy-6-metoxy-1,4-benzoquinol methylase